MIRYRKEGKLVKIKLPKYLRSVTLIQCPVCDSKPVFIWFMNGESIPLTVSCANPACWPVIKQIA